MANVAHGPARTSSRQVVTFLQSYGLEATLDDAATDDFDTVFEALTQWYADPDRAAMAKVFVVRPGDEANARALSTVLSRWLASPLPPLRDESLVQYVADALMIDAHHSDDADSAPQLFSIEAEGSTLYLLRPEERRTEFAVDDTWAVGSLNSPDTEAAIQGIYRFEVCTPAFADHAVACARCQALLSAWEARGNLPDGFEQFRRRPLRPPVEQLPPLAPVSGVGIVIPRAPTTPPAPKKKPWWKF